MSDVELDLFNHEDGSYVACIPCTAHRNGRETSSDTFAYAKEDFEFGKALELQSHLLEYVMEYLDFSSLQSAKLVNDIWKSLAVRELNRRNISSWITCTYRKSICDLETSPNFSFNNIALGLLAYNPALVKLEKYVCVHNMMSSERMTFAEYFSKEVVPPGVNYCILSCTKVSPANIANKNSTSLYQGVFIPAIPKVQIVPFYFNAKKDPTVLSCLKDSEHVKCLLVFTRRYQLKQANTLLSTLLDGRPFDSMAMGGGLIKSSKVFPMLRQLVRAEDLFCIAFIQEKDEEANFNAYSQVICENNTSKEEHNKMFEEVLIKMKETNTFRKSGIVFRFCCFAKTFKDEENSIIEKHFPAYTTFSIDVDGEIGWDTLNGDSSNAENSTEDCDTSNSPKRKKPKTLLPQTLHGWSSVLVVVTWGKEL